MSQTLSLAVSLQSVVSVLCRITVVASTVVALSIRDPSTDFHDTRKYNYFPDTTPHAKFQEAMSTWVVWANSQFDT